jgi:hypothetical protein
MAEQAAHPSVDELPAGERDDLTTAGSTEIPTAPGESVPADQANGWFVGPPEAPERYELLGPGLAGGEGVTWRARYRGGLSAPLPLAVKVLHRPSAAGPEWPTVADRSRWHDQTALLRHLRPEHVVRVNEISAGPGPHRLGEPPDGRDSVFIEMEWVAGPTLAERVRGHPADPATLRERIDWLSEACEGLAHLHSHTRTAGNPTVHRDVTPANCIINPERGLVLIDVSTLQLPADGVDLAGRHTPAYSAPEVLSDPHSPRGPEADVYAVGALAFFCFTGEDPPAPVSSPVSASSGGELGTPTRRQLQGALSRLALKPALLEHVLVALDPDPGRRPTDLLGWAERLRALAVPRRTVAASRAARRPRVFVTAGVVACVAAGVGGWLAFGGPDAPDRSDAGKPLPLASSPAGVTAASGTITFPKDEATVKDCSYFTGTARLPAGTTLLLAKQNLSNGDERKYVQDVFDFAHPQAAWSWRGAQFFNDGSVGQTQRVELIAVPVRSALQADETADTEALDTLARSGTVLDSVDVVRGPGLDGRTDCHPPS